MAVRVVSRCVPVARFAVENELCVSVLSVCSTVLDLEPVEQNLFLAQPTRSPGTFRLFGGQVLAQALRAAYQTVDGRNAHSLHGYFMRAGTAQRGVLFEVERIRDGKSFTTRRVVAVQNGKAIFSVDASFQVEEAGFDQARPIPNVPRPDVLEDDVEVAKAYLEGGKTDRRLSMFALRERPFEMRSVFRIGTEQWARNRSWNPVWIRFRAPLAGADEGLARCLLAYASDMGLVSSAALPHQESISRNHLQMASLDHALWFHRAVPIDGWLLFHKRTAWADAARGLTHAEFFSEDGALVASVTQEGLVRVVQS